MIRTGNQTDQVRHHQADEADHPRSRHCGADAEGSAKHQFGLQSLDVEAQVTGLGLAEQQCVQRICPAR